MPISFISISHMSPAFMFLECPSVPIQIISPGTKVKYRDMALMKRATPKIIEFVGNEIVSILFNRTVVTNLSRFTSVSIHGPIGLKVSVFFALHIVRSSRCHLRSLTSFPMVYPNTKSSASSSDIFFASFPIIATNSPSY